MSQSLCKYLFHIFKIPQIGFFPFLEFYEINSLVRIIEVEKMSGQVKGYVHYTFNTAKFGIRQQPRQSYPKIYFWPPGGQLVFFLIPIHFCHSVIPECQDLKDKGQQDLCSGCGGGSQGIHHRFAHDQTTAMTNAASKIVQNKIYKCNHSCKIKTVGL